MVNDVVLNKIAVIERCVNRIREVYANSPDNLKNFTLQDSIVLNIQRACEASINLAMHLVSIERIGIPKTSLDAFKMLEEQGILAPALSKNLQSMVGFRNIAVHDYQAVNISILQSIVEKHLDDFLEYTRHILKRSLA